MTTRRILLTEGDTRPLSVLALDDALGRPLDISGTSDVVRFKLRALNATAIKATIVCNKLVGRLTDDGETIETTAPYDTPGRGGRVEIPWTVEATSAAGEYEGEVEITFGDGRVQTLPKRVPVTILEQM
jgi:hypothetical protein